MMSVVAGVRWRRNQRCRSAGQQDHCLEHRTGSIGVRRTRKTPVDALTRKWAPRFLSAPGRRLTSVGCKKEAAPPPRHRLFLLHVAPPQGEPSGTSRRTISSRSGSRPNDCFVRRSVPASDGGDDEASCPSRRSRGASGPRSQARELPPYRGPRFR